MATVFQQGLVPSTQVAPATPAAPGQSQLPPESAGQKGGDYPVEGGGAGLPWAPRGEPAAALG